MDCMVHGRRGSVAAVAALLLAVLASQFISPAQLAPQGEQRPAPDAAKTEALRLNNLGVAYMNQQRMEEALKAFEQAYASDSALSTARLNQGIALLNLRRMDAAQEVLLEATQREPKNVRAWYNLGLLHKNLGQAEQALEAFKRVEELDPQDPDTHYFIATLYAQLQKYEQAIAAFEQALVLNPFHPSAAFGLARSLQRLGESAKAREHLARFQKLTQEKLGAPMSLAYGEQGKYSLAQQVTYPAALVEPPAPVRFVSVAGEVGLDFQHRSGLSGVASPDEALEAQSAVAFLGSGACVLDYDRDARPDVFLVNSGPEAASALYRNNEKGGFVEVTEAARLDARGYGMGCTAGDYDNDRWIDLAVSFVGRIALFRNQGDGTFREVTEAAGIRAPGLPLGITFLDYDHDGDLDLYAARFVQLPGTNEEQKFDFPLNVSPTTNQLWRNNGNGTFTDWTASAGLEGLAASVGAASADFNNDRAVDLVVTGWSAAPLLLTNPREGPFRPSHPWAEPMSAPTAGLVVLDFNKDGWMDLAFTHWGQPGLSLWRNAEGKRFERVSLPESNWSHGWGAVALDYDNDGWVDLAAVGESAERGEIRLLRNRGSEGFADVSSEVGLVSIELAHPRALITADYDQDGDADLLVTQQGGPVVLLRNDGGNRNHWLRVSLQGLTDNKSAIGTKVEIFAGPLYQKWEVQAASGYLGQSSLEVIAGLGRANEAEVVRLLWPTGVLQDEVELAAGQRHPINEMDRRGSSCPILFAWDGRNYRFIADAVGPGIVGHWVAPGQRNVPDPTEYLKVEGSQLRLRQGRLSFRFVEPMEEVVYLDQVRLLAVDHTAEIDIYPNEYFASRPPFPAFKVISSRGARPPVGAWDDRGRNILSQIQHRDRVYVTEFPLLPFRGFAELHALELDLGLAQENGPLRLLLHGLTDYFTATSVYAAHQAGIQPVVPYVEVLDPSGRWVRIADDIGFPAGLARTMVADLTGRLPRGSRRIRIWTNLRIYWDQVLIDRTPEGEPHQIHEVPLAEATLGFLGYPRELRGNPPSDITYSYADISRSGPYAPHVGSYTGYGEVRTLVKDRDDRFVILGSGEEVALEFDAGGTPALPVGWRRDYFFFVDAFSKDRDFYAAYGDTVEPLPFHGMSRYPYPREEDYPEGALYLDYRLETNTRQVGEGMMPRFRFDYRPRRSPGQKEEGHVE